MEQRVSMVTLGVADIERAATFYRALGWEGQEVQDTVFFQAGGMVLVLWGRADLAADAGLPDAAADHDGAPTSGGIALAHNVRTSDEVDEIMATAGSAGATITTPAHETFYGGYAGYFVDPDGHLWEIAHNPGFTLDHAGNLVLPDFTAG